MDEEWLPEAADILWGLEEKYPLNTLWDDFLLWAAYQASQPYDELRASLAVAEYNDDIVWTFGKLYNVIGKAVKLNPKQNVLLKLAWALHLADKYDYGDAKARQMMVNRVHEEREKTRNGKKPESAADLERLLREMNVQFFTVMDKAIVRDSGSFLIAMANVIREYYPKDYQERAMLIAPRSADNNRSSLMAFIQCSLMGMASYACVSRHYGVLEQLNMDLFAPPEAFCSPAFYLEPWHQARVAAMNAVALYGLPEE